MPLRLYDSQSRSLREFQPLEPGVARVYGCGPTIYARAHIGNFRSFVAYDLLHRYLQWSGYDTRFVINFTDVDDKTISGAAREGTTLNEFTAPFAEAFLADAQQLGIRPFWKILRATEHVDEMIAWVEKLIERGLAYPAEDGSVYYRIADFPGYGKLSGNRADADAGRSRIDSDEYEKDDVRDFVLWKASKPEDEQVGASWQSPWGKGRPGWHLECSVLSIEALGESLDIHLGGEDLVFPHHENEIAQSEGVTGKPFVGHWMHIKHLRIDDEKMSKSLGNFLTLHEVLGQGFEAAAVRHQLLSAHYRSELNFSSEGLEGSAQAVQRLLDFKDRIEGLAADADAEPTALSRLATAALERFREGLDDDLNSAHGLAALFVLLREVNGELDRVQGRVGEGEKKEVLDALASMDEVLGILKLAESSRGVDADTESWIEERVQARNDAREARDFASGDAIRDELLKAGIVLEDTAQGTRWKRIHQR